MKQFRLKTEPDPNPESPRHSDALGEIVCWHSRHKLGDSNPTCDPREWSVYHSSELGVKLPVYLLDHSSLCLSTTPFSDQWDSGKIGWIYCSLDTARNCWASPDATWETRIQWKGKDHSLREIITCILTLEVEEYSAYLNGDVYRYEVEVYSERCQEWQHCDGGSGYYSEQDCEKAGQAALQSIVAQDQENDRRALAGKLELRAISAALIS